MNQDLGKRGWFLLIAVASVGLALRLLYPADMEYKEDEAYYFVQSQIIGASGYWPWVGIPSGAYLRNPGGSIWIFALLARLTGATTPIALSVGLRIFQWLSLFLIFPVFRRLTQQLTANTRLAGVSATQWALGVFAWAMVNPFLIYYARKLWTQAFLPAFALGVIYFFLERKYSQRAAFFWGLLGAWIGQIHMSGFFFAFGIVVITALSKKERKGTNWWGWFVGSVLGALPLIPWLWDAWLHTPPEAMTRGVTEMIQLKFWVFFFTQPFGLHLGNVMGTYLGSSHLAQLSEFVRYPVIGGVATYGSAVAHLTLVGLLVFALYKIVSGAIHARRSNPLGPAGTREWRSLLLATLGIAGAALTLTGVQIRRYYIAVFFPLDTALVLRHLPQVLWCVGWIAQAVISGSFVQSIHANQGAKQGDYGPAYHTMVKP